MPTECQRVWSANLQHNCSNIKNQHNVTYHTDFSPLQ
jgi:hypothetical protein